MRRRSLAALAAVSLFATGCVREPGDEQALVDRSTLSVQEMMTSMGDAPRDMLRKARAVIICPRLFKAGFFAGGQGGACVMVARSGNGTWSYPAFYGLGSGSFGLQFGIQDAQMLMMILTQKGLDAVLDSQFKFGANASVAVATIGAEVQGSTTAAVGADIVAFAMSRGLFGGIALEGSIMGTRTEWNQGYYGQPFGARQIVMQMQGVNPGADPLRQVLTRYGAAGPAMASGSRSAEPSELGRSGGHAEPAPARDYTSGARGPIQEQNLTPPAR